MILKPFDIVGFDLDGTLCDTSLDLAEAVNYGLASLGRPALSIETIKPMIGQGVRHMFECALRVSGNPHSGEFEPGLADLLQFYEANIARNTVPFPGLAQTLDAMRADGIALAVVTNKLEKLAVRLVSELGLAEYFQCVIGGDRLGAAHAKPSPSLLFEMVRRCGGGTAAFVGDSAHDVIAARSAGMPAVVVSFGFIGRTAEALGANAVIDSFDELMPTLERLAATRRAPAGTGASSGT